MVCGGERALCDGEGYCVVVRVVCGEGWCWECQVKTLKGNGVKDRWIESECECRQIKCKD